MRNQMNTIVHQMNCDVKTKNDSGLNIIYIGILDFNVLAQKRSKW